ncbi:proline--tRNA ligase [Candidatus Peribacteria bacterium RIFCSPHIGHO2_02_FULL_52_16]|nr:MAG: proline--tRNA ligase [Candidatus Peribacteria bacterium RIFCSPHIGHO2_01_FULL_51_35]OGJ61765.1 MAG: proline--tRNA ligase [Candidatus Peribacteria bacterium RIFCSPHIGHO2_02_FULL_52_16]
MQKIADQTKDFPQWYLDVIAEAGLAEHADVKGCIIFKPYGYALWEAIQFDLNRRIKEQGVENAYFPLLIPESIIAKEKDHVEGFAPECAVVTHGGGKELTEKLYIRPTSETIIYATFAKWIQSHRDLPLKINQWANVVRWEMRTRPFLRTLEFLWQEGHTCHATKEEADAMVEGALQMYADFDREMLAIPVMSGRKPEHEKFAGALYTLSTEALAKDGKAIQAGTSHNLGQGFSQAYGVSFLNEAGKATLPWMTSWGLSTRIIGTLIVVHGDEKGLRLPPKIAPIQVVIVPIYKTDEEKKNVLAAAKKLVTSLGDLRVKLDDRDEKSPGFKFNEWEVKGVPVRIELGPKDLEKKAVMLCRRDTGEKQSVAMASCTKDSMQTILDEIQDSLYEQAKKYMEDHTTEADSYDALQKVIDADGGFVWAPWDGTLKTANAIKDKTKATIRLLGDASKAKGKKDLVSGDAAKEWALFAKAY